MLINKIQSTNFKAIYEDNNYMITSNDNKIKNDIINKLRRPFPNDKKKRDYVKYLKEEKDIDILLTKEKTLPITVIAVKDAKANGDKIVDYKNQFKVGDYYIRNFNPDDILEADRNQKQFKIMKIVSYLLMAITAGLLLINGINRHNIKQSMLEAEKMLEMKSGISDTLKIIKNR